MWRVKNRHSHWLIGMLVLLGSSQTWAIGNFKPTPAELGALPAFCGPRAQPWGNQSDHPEVKPWLAIYGPDWGHMHHYCSGLNFINQSYRANSQYERERVLRAAIREIDYTLRNVRKDTALVAELLSARGTALLGLKEHTEASRDLERAIVINPKLRRAYSLLADSYVALKRKDKALEMVTEGVRHNPDSTVLKRRYDELGGKKPYPEPYVAAATETQAAPDATVKPADAPPAADSPAQPETPTQPETPASAPPPIGSPTNPYCRFCP